MNHAAHCHHAAPAAAGCDPASQRGTTVDAYTREPRIAYFSMEIALANDIPTYSGERAAWIAVMKGAICKSASFFNSHRMLRRYATEAYIR